MVVVVVVVGHLAACYCHLQRLSAAQCLGLHPLVQYVDN